MSKLKTASNFGSHVELTEVKILSTAKLKQRHIALIPLKTDEKGKHTAEDGFLLSFESSIELAVNILTEVLGSENAGMVKPIMERVKLKATKKALATISD